MMKRKIQSGFTLVELLIAMVLLLAIFVASGFIFHSAIRAQRTSKGVLEITQKLQTITSQLDEDFTGLKKDGPIFMAWELGLAASGGYERFDRMMFFADGNYEAYKSAITGNVARVTYMLARDGTGAIAQDQKAKDRILARSQHIQIKNPDLYDFPSLSTGTIPIPLYSASTPSDLVYTGMNNGYEYDNTLIADWNNVSDDELWEMVTVATDFQIKRDWVSEDPDPTRGGLIVSSSDPNSIHMRLCDGVGSFSVQSWYDDSASVPPKPRWIPEIDPDGDGVIDDPVLADNTDFNVDGSGNIDSSNSPWLLYPRNFGRPVFGPASTLPTTTNPYLGPFNSTDFNNIPGLGRALKFTFTLYDSKGVFPDGKVFSYIVYLD